MVQRSTEGVCVSPLDNLVAVEQHHRQDRDDREDYNRFDLSDSVWTLLARKPFFPLAMIMRLARTKEGGNA